MTLYSPNLFLLIIKIWAVSITCELLFHKDAGHEILAVGFSQPAVRDFVLCPFQPTFHRAPGSFFSSTHMILQRTHNNNVSSPIVKEWIFRPPSGQEEYFTSI
jgi:hypothetical protein